VCIPPICYGTSSGGISASQQKIDHSYQSANGQSGIAAGSGGFDLTVGGDTHLKGGAITSTAEAAQNRLTTRSLSYEDLDNRQKTNSSSASLSLAGGMDAGKGTAPSISPAGQAAGNLLANLGGQQGLPKNSSEHSQTLAVISPATITLTQPDEAGQQAAATLTGRDPATANQALTNTLTLQDTARLQQQTKEEQQNAKAASLIGQVAAGIIGDLTSAMKKPVADAALRQELDAKQAGGKALSNVERYELDRLDREGMSSGKAAQTLADPEAIANYRNWQDGSTNKIILHGLSGVLQAKIGTGSALVGATAGAANEALIPAMSDYLESQGIKQGSDEYKGYMQLGSAMLGAGIGAIADGSNGAALGGTVAHNATTYNRLLHPDEEKWIKKNAKKFAEKEGISEKEATERLTQQALKDVDYLWRAVLADGNDAGAKSFLDGTQQTFVNDLGEQQKFFTAQGTQLFRPEMYANTADTAFYRQYAESGVSRGLEQGLIKELKDSGIDIKNSAVEFGKALKDNPAVVGQAVTQAVWNAVQELPESIVKGFLETGGALGEGAAVALTPELNEKLNALYGVDVSAAQKTLLTLRLTSAILGAAGTAKTAEFAKEIGVETVEVLGKQLDKALAKAEGLEFASESKAVAAAGKTATDKVAAVGADSKNAANVLIEKTWKTASEFSPADADHVISNAIGEGTVYVKTDANLLNLRQIAAEDKPSYLPDTKVVGFSMNKPTEYVRVYNPTGKSNQAGGWMMRAEDVAGLSAEQIAAKYSLPEIPSMITNVSVPAGTKIEVSVANNIFLGADKGGGGLQFRVVNRPTKPGEFNSWFTNPKDLK
jgi:filamentous hemagglutinin